MKLKLLAGVALATMALAGYASAEQAPGWYGALDLGANVAGDDYDGKASGNMVDGSPFRYNISTDQEWEGFARLGYRYNDNWRVEFEGGMRPGDLRKAFDPGARDYGPAYGGYKESALCTSNVIRTPTDPCGGPKGSFDVSTMMVNLYYDFLPESSIHPFVGVGAGLAKVSVKGNGQMSVNPAEPIGITTVELLGEDQATAIQGIAGFAWALSERLSVDLTYRYLAVGKTDIAATARDESTGAVLAANSGWQPGVLKGELSDQSVTVGLRWAFGSPVAPPPVVEEVAPPPPPYVAPPPPPPPPPPARPEARTFIVYFEFDKSDLTADAQAVVSAAADYAKNGGAARVVVVGHADTSGSAAYNVRLSERRAKKVADALVGLGVDGSKLAVDWKGESQPAVATGDGVKEPLNRRSTIDIAF